MSYNGEFRRINIAKFFGEPGKAFKADPRIVGFPHLVIEQRRADYPNSHQMPDGLGVKVGQCVSLRIAATLVLCLHGIALGGG
ncbi:hypothetical protein MN113_20495 [Pseudomonas veronii]|uniref:hypothetical protein n=1 Tax=Pseudomonas veronii TaxID=76761 RepID=UPI0021C02974|nr:hypothetical protein [Pseudomonas veronii]MCT8963559.1 hypothetical protein [Pseudomonas veronii]